MAASILSPFKTNQMNSTSLLVEEIKISYKPTNISNQVIKSSRDAFDILKEYFNKDTLALQESFIVLYLNQGNMVKGIHVHSVGGITSTVVDTRLVLAVALASASTSIVLCHNHPSGSLRPSQQDIALTQKIRAGCKLLDIQLYDHLIISPNDSYYSFSDEGDLFGMAQS